MKKLSIIDSKEKIKKLTDEMETYLKTVSYNQESYKKFLCKLGQFRDYSVRNIALIKSQNTNAQFVTGFKKWEEKGRKIRKGEKGIKILVPVKVKNKKDNEEDFNLFFKQGYVFDVSQTEPIEGREDLHCLFVDGLKNKVNNFDNIYKKIEEIAMCKIKNGVGTGGSFGVFYNFENKKNNLIKIKGGISQSQQIKTMLHEIAHSRLHNKERLDPRDEEIQAESIAYLVSNMLKINTIEYSFNYLAGYVANDIKAFTNNLFVIKKEALKMYDEITNSKEEVLKDKEIKKPKRKSTLRSR